ncbi:polysaccharide deacetylase family protein [Flavilitoribacter nigricans]|uniref:NodB homology domain-containing protein n=1 Tax=Flavilitoribacter nigricans (strain ATCC 23147 / DSM 23189 / NBRC 102662 / NCIMB 1420 / SS-2) TaxID=1122177 RepID=A0A2D0N2B2_FLAN2|nr:polysaccharide deacetylase family protein [Flavilitoribacter nigricans]PHN02661.1 hypothetical protein CRP01_31190 [Flavilitoribacter nigricans DSM 23189 = NBRC 102662]
MLHLKYRFVFACLWFVISLPGQETSFPWPDGKKAALSLSFDDGRNSQVDVGRDLFKKLDAKATFYVVPGNMQDRIDGWKQLLADGHEIGNHTVYHPCTGNFQWSRDKALENYTLSTMRRELTAANQQIKELLGVLPESFAYTCGNTFVGRGRNTQSYVPLIAELFESGRGWLNEASNDPAFADMALLQGIEMDGKDFETDIKPLVDAALEDGSWLLLAGHDIGPDGRQTTRTAMLEKLVAYVQRPESGIWLAPVGTVAAYVKEQRQRQSDQLRDALVFATTFDQGVTADFARGDARLYSAASYEQLETATPNLLPQEITLAENQGHFGHALEFKRKGQPVVFYQVDGNLPYATKDWGGTISLWLSLDPETDLEPGYTDPIQITDSGYDDAALWVDFSDKNPRSFRMGVYGDVDQWNPQGIGPDKNPAFNQRLLPAEDRPFQRGRWTHVVISFDQLNDKAGMARFYINGRPQGERKITESFTWKIEEAKIFLGLNFVGLIDEVALFDRALSTEEVKWLYQLAEGLPALLGK